MRPDQRADNELRPVSFQRGYTKYAEGAVLAAFGDTQVLCTATVQDTVPGFLRNSGQGWVTAEYAMLPRSAGERVSRDAVRKGRALEISRLIGRSLRNVVELTALGERQILIDCDVIQADGGTRTAAITGAYLALHDALQHLVDQGALPQLPLLGQCAAVSVGVVEGEPRLDLSYEEDAAADVDMNLVIRSDDAIIEIQGCAEGDAFPKSMLDQLVDLGMHGARILFDIQRKALAGA
ncbi:MAG: ribonuclease PH [Candidatus Hydrogenedentes bacterium]|nr:ribonuclease PH [Candidatus Hydrogenedentota bacterium]